MKWAVATKLTCACVQLLLHLPRILNLLLAFTVVQDCLNSCLDSSKYANTYSDDLRWRIVWLRIARDMEPREIAYLLCIGESTVCHYTQRFYENGSVSPTEYHHGPHKLLNEFEQVTVMQSLLNKPSMYLGEVCDELFKATGHEVHPSTICRTIHSLGFTRQKLRKVALQQSEDKRGEFLAEMAFLDPSMFVWLDETGSDRHNNIHRYGYGLRGITPVDHQLRIGGNRVSAIGVMSMRAWS